MIRLACLLVLLSGCTTSRSAASGAPSTLADVNAALDGAAAEILFTDGTRILRAEWVEVGETVTDYSTTMSGYTTRRSTPTAKVARIAAVSRRPRSGGGALLGALPGATLAVGSVLSLPEGPNESLSSQVQFGFLSFQAAAGVVVSFVGAAVGASVERRRAPTRYVVLYEGPVERYRAAPGVRSAAASSQEPDPE